MIRRFRFATILAATIGLLLAESGVSSAQLPYSPFAGPGGGPANSPAYSPYLNLRNRGQSAGANYYGVVRPQMELQNAYLGLQQQFNAQQNSQQEFDQRGIPFTGHAATFMNYRSYFLTISPAFNQRPGLGGGQGQAGRAQGPQQGTSGAGTPSGPGVTR